jgi:hypothetical protein
MNNTKNQIVEFAQFRLAEGVDELTLFAASDALQEGFLKQQKGFIKRELVKLEDGTWADILYWENRESVEHALLEAPTNPAALAYFQLMAQDEASSNMLLLSVAKSYS